MRPGSMLEGMWLDIATPEEDEVVRRLYDKRNFGSAEQVAVRRIREVWTKMINQNRLSL